MLSSTKRRISTLERSIQVPMTAERFLARVEEFSRLTSATPDEAFQSVASSLDQPALDRLAEEFMQLACGDDLAAREEITRLATIMAAGTK
jgi:hypothetical protein